MNEEKSMNNKTIMHINFGEIEYDSYGKKSIDDICKQAAETGFDGIEFRGMPPQELRHLSFREYATQIGEAKKKYGLSEILFGNSLAGCDSNDQSVRDKVIAEALEKAKIVQDICGTTLCNTFASKIVSKDASVKANEYEKHGSAVATDDEWKYTVDSYQKIGKELEKMGMRFAFETHMNYIHDVPVAAKKLVDLIDSPAIGINMDYGNTFFFPNQPTVQETIDLYGDKLFYTHLKNYTKLANGVLPGYLSDGEINHRLYLAKLKEVGYTGPIGVEAPRSGDRVWFAKQDYAYFKSVMADI